MAQSDSLEPLINTRITSDHRPRLQDKTSKYAGPMDVVRSIVRQHGPLGLYAGMESTFWRSELATSTTLLS